MFKKIMLHGTIVLTLFSLAGLTSCGSNTELVDTEYFKCKINKKEGYASIIGLTGLGMEQEVLDVPMYLEGLPVTQIGGNKKLWSAGETISSELLKKLYIPHTVDTILYRLTLANVSEIVVNKLDVSISCTNQMVLSDIIHLTLQGAEERPNVTFFYNYEGALNDGYYCFDYITGSSLYLLPQSPVRKNYEFVDWYLEPELITPWNKIMPESVDEVLNLYAKWDEKQK